ncbi:MAG TPA: hypothetical protein PJ982_17005, partial [Lacipirellulaceae bacterium]|nr:hypothetical protein [Lacipirellulaceae bacterium]
MDDKRLLHWMAGKPPAFSAIAITVALAADSCCEVLAELQSSRPAWSRVAKSSRGPWLEYYSSSRWLRGDLLRSLGWGPRRVAG